MFISTLKEIPRNYTIYVINPLTVIWSNKKILATFLLLLKKYKFKILFTRRNRREHSIEFLFDSLSSTYLLEFLEKCDKFFNINIGWRYHRFPFKDSKFQYIIIERIEIRDVK